MQMQITSHEIARRREILGISGEDLALLKNGKWFIEEEIDAIVDSFYQVQTSVPEIAL